MGYERRGLLPGLQVRADASPRARAAISLGLQFAQLRLLRGSSASSGQQEQKEQAAQACPNLELYTEAELPLSHLSKICDGKDLAGCGRIHLRVRLAQVHVVECVEQLRAELALTRSVNWNFLLSEASVLKKCGPKNELRVDVAEGARGRAAPRPARAAVGIQQGVAVAVVEAALSAGAGGRRRETSRWRWDWRRWRLPTRLARHGPVSSSLPQLT